MARRINMRDSYQFYKKIRKEKQVNITIYLKIVSGFIQFIMEIVRKGCDIELAGGRNLGIMGIRGKKMDIKIAEDGEVIGGRTNWKETYALRARDPIAKENGERIYHLNDHTNSVEYRHYWWGEGMKITNKRVYTLVMARGNRRALPEAIRQGSEYIIKTKTNV